MIDVDTESVEYLQTRSGWVGLRDGVDLQSGVKLLDGVRLKVGVGHRVAVVHRGNVDLPFVQGARLKGGQKVW